MEETLMRDGGQFGVVMAAAAKPGATARPDALLAATASETDPIAAVSDLDRGNGLFEAFRSEFGFIDLSWATQRPVSAEELDRWTALMRWLTGALRGWKRADDVKRATLVALLIVMQSCDRHDELWRSLPDDIGENNDLLETLAVMVGGLRITFNSRGSLPAPIWETEEVERFKEADAQADWIGIASCWQKFGNVILPSAIVTQAVQCLFRFAFDRLVQALDDVRQTPVAMQVAGVLSIEHRLRLALASANPYVQFSSAYQTLTPGRNAPPLSGPERALLVELLLKIADDADRWQAWMGVFNRYPVRFPMLQESLGRALALVPDSAIESYVGSINLSATPGEGRRRVAECLRSFRETANSGRRRTLWGSAFERWTTWRFDTGDRDSHLMQIAQSELDYAVAAYATECMDDGARQEAMDGVRRQLSAVEFQWHTSETDCLTAWNCLLSQFQPYAHASQTILSDADWLAEGLQYYPFDPKQSDYLRIMYRMRA